MDQFFIFALISGAVLAYDRFSHSGVNDIIKTLSWFVFVISAIVFIGRQF